MRIHTIERMAQRHDAVSYAVSLDMRQLAFVNGESPVAHANVPKKSLYCIGSRSANKLLMGDSLIDVSGNFLPLLLRQPHAHGLDDGDQGSGVDAEPDQKQQQYRQRGAPGKGACVAHSVPLGNGRRGLRR